MSDTNVGATAQPLPRAAGYAIPSFDESEQAIKSGTAGSLHHLIHDHTPADSSAEQRFRQQVEAALSYAYSLGWCDRADRELCVRHNSDSAKSGT